MNEGLNNQDTAQALEVNKMNEAPENMESAGVSHETGEDMLGQAKEVLAKANANEAVLSKETSEKKGFFGKIMEKISGNAPLSPKEDAAVHDELINHKNWNVKEAYEQAKLKGIDDKYRKAYKRKGLPLYLNKEGTDYTGQSFVAQ